MFLRTKLVQIIKFKTTRQLPDLFISLLEINVFFFFKEMFTTTSVVDNVINVSE